MHTNLPNHILTASHAKLGGEVVGRRQIADQLTPTKQTAVQTSAPLAGIKVPAKLQLPTQEL